MEMTRTRRAATLGKAARPAMIALAMSFFATAAFAVGTAEQRAACTPDVFRLCSSEIPNVTNIIACMKAKKSSLSPACRAVFNDPVAKGTEAAQQTAK